MSALDRRIIRLENPDVRRCADLATGLEAARMRWRDDAVGARRDSRERRAQFLSGCAAAVAKGRTLSPLEARLKSAILRLDAAA